VLRTLRWELALIVMSAAALGTGAAWLTLSGFSRGMVGAGAPAFVLTTYALVLAGATALTLIGTVVPARMVLRRHPAEDINQA
jgi:putative ABC transport system permease protein